jgi:hypothetical protein
MKAFFDGSGGAEMNFMVLTGVYATDNLWAKFDDRWREILAARSPAAPYLHMRELTSFNGAFTRDKGWDVTKTSSLVNDCMMYVQGLDKQDYRSFTCTIDMLAYREIRARGDKLPNPYRILSRFSPELVLQHYLKKFADNYPQEIHYFFDQGEKYKGIFERRWMRGKKSGKGLLNHWHLIKSVDTVDMKDYPAVQFADLLAWAHHRRLMNEKSTVEVPWQHLCKVAETILPFTRKEVTRDDLEMFVSAGTMVPWMLTQEFGD